METPTITTTSYAAQNAVRSMIADPLLAAKYSLDLRAGRQSDIANFPEAKEETTVGRRMVRVLMVDPDENVPADAALLYDSKEVFTDKTDQELYFDIPMADILAKHNALRTTLVDKEVKDRTQYLEPARIRDLKMIVVELAKF